MTKSYNYIFGILAIIVILLLFSFVPRSCSSEDTDLETEVGGNSSSAYTEQNATISELYLDKVQLDLYIEEQEKLTASVIMSDNSVYTGSYRWNSSNEAVASVSSDGLVCGLSEGTSYVQVVVDDGQYAICVVKVSDPTKGDENPDEQEEETTQITPQDVFQSTFPDTDKFFYRVGNENDVQLGYIFEVLDGFEDYIDDVEIEYDPLESETDVSVTFTPSQDDDWSHGILCFSGSGLVKLIISVYVDEEILEEGLVFDSIKPYSDSGVPEGDILLNSFELYLEVEDGDNVVDANQLGGRDQECDVLLCDITLDSFKTLSYTGESRLFGNGFTLSINATSQYSGGAINLEDSARMDHLILTIADHYNVFNQADYILFNDGVDCSGDNIIISNCYIQGGRAAVRNRATNLTLRDTVINGGAYANLLITTQSNVILQDVTTNQYVTCDGEGVMGFGVLVEDSADGSIITVVNDFKQYNWISLEDTKYFNYSFESYDQSLADVFTNYEQYEDGAGELNTGVLGLGSDFTFNTDQITDGIVYHEITIVDRTINGLKGWTVDASATKDEFIFTDFDIDASTILDYGVVEPTFNWNLESSTNDGGTTFVYNDDTKLVTITISLTDMVGYSWTPKPTVTKYGVPLSYTLVLDYDSKIDDDKYNVDVTDGYIFSREDEGDHYISAFYTDPYNYRHNGEDDVESYPLSYTQTLHISVIVEQEQTVHASFQFGSKDNTGGANDVYYDTTIIDIGYDKYVTIDNYDGRYSNDSEIVEYNPTDSDGNLLLDENGEPYTLYAPKEYSVQYSNFFEQLAGNIYWYYPVLTTITVTDYEGGLSGGNQITYDRSVTTTSGVFSFGGETPFDVLTPSDNYWSGSYNGSSCTFSTYESHLCIKSYARNNKNSYAAQEWIGEFTYQDEAGQLYHYGIDYYRAAYTHS